MSNIILSLNVVLPLFLMIALGFFLRLKRLLDDYSLTILNNICFKVFLPVMLFFNIYSASLDGILNTDLILFAVVSVFIIFSVLCFVIPFIEKDNRKRGVMVQGLFRSNFIIFGIPISSSLYGEESLGIISLLIAVIVPIFNALAVISLEMFRKGRIDFKKIILSIIKNPLIIASALGLFFLFTGIKLPFFFEKTIGDLSKVATPLILVTLGGYFTFSTVNGHFKQLFITIIGKLLLIPAIFIPIAIFLGFKNAELACLIALFAAPTAVTSFTMAKQMNGDAELSGHIVVFTSALSIISLFFWIFILKQMGFM